MAVRIRFASPSRPRYAPPRAKAESKAERDKFYSGRRWRELRARKLRADPLCARCLAAGLVVEADTVHHVRERLDHPELAYTWSNLESSCKPCHTTHHKARPRP